MSRVTTLNFLKSIAKLNSPDYFFTSMMSCSFISLICCVISSLFSGMHLNISVRLAPGITCIDSQLVCITFSPTGLLQNNFYILLKVYSNHPSVFEIYLCICGVPSFSTMALHSAPDLCLVPCTTAILGLTYCPSDGCVISSGFSLLAAAMTLPAGW